MLDNTVTHIFIKNSKILMVYSFLPMFIVKQEAQITKAGLSE